MKYLLLICFLFTGCVDNQAIQENQQPIQTRFTVSQEGNYLEVVTDTETDEQYLFYRSAHGAAFVKLEKKK